MAGWAAVALVNVFVIAMFRRSSLATQLLHHVFDFAQHIALGVISAGLVDAWLRWGPKRRSLSWMAFAAVALVAGAWMLPEDTSILARKIAIKGPVGFWHGLLVATASMSVVLAFWFGRLLAHPVLAWLGVVAAIAAATANHFVVSHDYPGMHFFVAWSAATLLGSSIAQRTNLEPFFVDRHRASILGVLAVATLWSLVVPPSNAVRLALFRSAGSVVAPWATRFQRRVVSSSAVSVSAESRPWFAHRDGHAEIPPSRALSLPASPIVILIVVDTMRADLMDGRRADLPNFTRLKRAGASFASARTPAPATTQAMSAVFAGRYYSQLYFTAKAGRSPEAMYPHEDETVRFPELLTRAGIDTVHLVGLTGLLVEYGIVRGFAEERLIKSPPRSSFAGSRELVPVAIERLKQQPRKPLFMYLHFNDPHFPYDLGGTQGSAFDRYLAEVRGVDTELGRLLDVIDASDLRDRTTVIVTADHGEGFGEHGENFHATSLYEELLRVPLIVRGPGVVPREVQEPASLIDIGPTVLDLFEQPTPGSFMGQTLGPLLAGKDVALHRPLIADSARLMRALIFRDGLKLIEDRRRGTVELYDLRRDPGERDNLWDRGGADAQSRLALLHAFFAEHTLKRPGYSPPYGR